MPQCTANVAYGSKAVLARCPRHVRFAPYSDRTADIAQRRRRAIFAVCNAGEAVIVAGLIERSFGSPFNLDRLRKVLGLLAAAVIGTAISGIGGTMGFVLFHTSAADAATIWYHWFSSDALGIVTTAPILIGLVSYARDPPPRTEVIEGFSALAA